jgi:MoaA/NifB/PqqE/SkfB family radical SAM enzyme
MMCSAADRDGSNLPPRLPRLSDLKRKIAQAQTQGVVDILIGGREPTLYPHLIDLMEFIAERGLGCFVGTNGRLFASMQMARRLLRVPTFTIKISFHSHRAEVFDRISGVPGSYALVVKGIKNLVSLFGAGDGRRHLFAIIVINRFNYQELPKTVRFLRSKGIRFVLLSYLTPSRRVKENPELLVDLDRVKPRILEAISSVPGMRFAFNKLPICILPSRARSFMPIFDRSKGVKVDRCVDCRFGSRCWGMPRTHFMALSRRKNVVD